MKLHELTIEALKHKAEVAAATHDPADAETAWAQVAGEQCRAVAAAGTTDALNQNPKAQDELENYLAGDMPAGEMKAIVTDLCRAGHYMRTKPHAVTLGRRCKTRTVDGVKYDTGW
jgi:predicted extracellular nuclease